MSIYQQVQCSELFKLSDPIASRPLRLSPQQDWVMERLWQLCKGEWQPPEPVLLKGYMGGMVADFLWADLFGIVCISHRVVELLEKNHFTGWATYPVEVYDRKEQHLPGYHGFSVISSAGDRDIRRSEIITNPPIVPRGQPYDVFKGVYFDESKWDGSDIFCVNGFIVVTRHLRDTFKRARVTNVLFTPLMEVETSVADYRIMGKIP